MRKIVSCSPEAKPINWGKPRSRRTSRVLAVIRSMATLEKDWLSDPSRFNILMVVAKKYFAGRDHRQYSHKSIKRITQKLCREMGKPETAVEHQITAYLEDIPRLINRSTLLESENLSEQEIRLIQAIREFKSNFSSVFAYDDGDLEVCHTASGRKLRLKDICFDDIQRKKTKKVRGRHPIKMYEGHCCWADGQMFYGQFKFRDRYFGLEIYPNGDIVRAYFNRPDKIGFRVETIGESTRVSAERDGKPVSSYQLRPGGAEYYWGRKGGKTLSWGNFLEQFLLAFNKSPKSHPIGGSPPPCAMDMFVYELREIQKAGMEGWTQNEVELLNQTVKATEFSFSHEDLNDPEIRQTILDRYQKGEPVFIHTGSRTHAVACVIMGSDLIVANRGRGCLKTESKRFCLPFLHRKIKDEDTLRHMMDQFHNQPKEIKEFYQRLEDNPGVVVPNQFLFNVIIDSFQKGGSCWYQSTRAGIFGLMILLASKMNPAQDEEKDELRQRDLAIGLARKLYRHALGSQFAVRNLVRYIDHQRQKIPGYDPYQDPVLMELMGVKAEDPINIDAKDTQ